MSKIGISVICFYAYLLGTAGFLSGCGRDDGGGVYQAPPGQAAGYDGQWDSEDGGQQIYINNGQCQGQQCGYMPYFRWQQPGQCFYFVDRGGRQHRYWKRGHGRRGGGHH